MELIESLLLILEKPHAKKGYKDFKLFLESIGRNKDAAALDYLISKKYADSSNSNPK